MRKVLEFAAGAALGVVLWLYATAGYNAVLATFAEPLLRLDPRLRGAEVLSNGQRIIARGDLDPTVPGVVIPADQLTYNIVLLLGLFATVEGGARRRIFLRLAMALAILFVTHVLAVGISLELTFATRTGAWGAARYSPLAQDLWTAVDYGYRLFAMFGIAFGLWVVLNERTMNERTMNDER